MDPFNDDDFILSEALSQYKDTDDVQMFPLPEQDVDDLQLTQRCEENKFNHDLATLEFNLILESPRKT